MRPPRPRERDKPPARARAGPSRVGPSRAGPSLAPRARASRSLGQLPFTNPTHRQPNGILSKLAFLTSTRTLFALNVFVLAVLAQNAGTVLVSHFAPSRSASSRPRRVQSRPLSHAGYVERRPATYRAPARGPVDAVLGLGMPGCGRQWARFAAQMGPVAPVRRVPVASARNVRLASPPVKLAPGLMAALATATRPARARLRRRVAYFAAHRTAWEIAIDGKRPRTLIIDEGLLLDPKFAHRLGKTIDAADEVSIARRAPWHVILLRRVRPKSHRRARSWAPGASGAPATVRVDDAAGAGAYVVSYAGAKLLLERAATYRGTIDDEMAKLAREDQEGFVMLDACTGRYKAALCPGVAADITVDEVREKVQCIWRRFEEQRLVAARG